jgi:hypothetical protein
VHHGSRIGQEVIEMMDGAIDAELLAGSLVSVVAVWTSWIIAIVRLGGVAVLVGLRLGLGEETHGMV